MDADQVCGKCGRTSGNMMDGKCRECRDHLHHMTDGRWHDDCPRCLHRRRHGGDGIINVNTGRCATAPAGTDACFT